MIFRYKIKFISDIEQKIRKLLVNIAVTPFVGVWIEIIKGIADKIRKLVTPFVGVWIEIEAVYKTGLCFTPSLPSWECGLKFRTPQANNVDLHVTPFVGVWIEIPSRLMRDTVGKVTPFVGVWIEIRK